MDVECLRPYNEAMENYGSDKPDLRIDLRVQDVTGVLGGCGFEPFAEGNLVKAVKVSDFHETRKFIDKTLAEVETVSGGKAYWFRMDENGVLAKNMMQSLLKERRSMAIVVDEFGGTSGMVTLEDLVEEIFGDIQDEHDRNSLVARRVNESTFEFSGRMEIEEINDSYHLDMPESDSYQTIAGLLLDHLGAIPSEGDTIDFGSFKVTVLKKSGARVELVRVVVTEADKQ